MKRQPLYVFWTGDNEMSPARRSSMESMASSGCEVVLVDRHNLHDYLPREQLHPAYEYLNLAHRADYLRCYFMKRYGGGYADIKPLNASWNQALEALESDDDIWAVGYPEVGRNGVANIHASSVQLGQGAAQRLASYLRWRLMRRRYRHLIGLCAFAFKPETPLVNAWWAELNVRLDALLPALRENPARYPRERPDYTYDGKPSHYPVPWTYLLGDIFHPLVLRHRRHVRALLSPPGFENYL